MTKDERRERDDESSQRDAGGTYYSAEKDADEAAAESGRKQGPGAVSTGDTGAGGPGATSHKSSGG